MKEPKIDLKELKELEEFYKAMEEDLLQEYTAEDLMLMEKDKLHLQQLM